MMPVLVMSMSTRPKWVMAGSRITLRRRFPMHDCVHIEIIDDAPFGKALRGALESFHGEQPVTVILDDMWLDRELTQDMLDRSYWLIEKGASSVRWHGDCRHYTYQNVETEPRKLARHSGYLMSLWPGMHRVDFLLNHIKKGDSPWDVERHGTDRVRESWPHDIYVWDFGGWCNMLFPRGKMHDNPQCKALLKELDLDLDL